jgi:hypothetical protein
MLIKVSSVGWTCQPISMDGLVGEIDGGNQSEITIKYGWLVVLTILKNDGVRQ